MKAMGLIPADLDVNEGSSIVFLSDNGANPNEPYFYSRATPEEIDAQYDNRPETEAITSKQSQNAAAR